MPVDKFGGDSYQNRNISGTDGSMTYINNNFLRKDGIGKAIGPLDMGKNRVLNVVDPIDDMDAVNKRYVMNETLRRDGGEMSGPLNMANNKIISVLDPEDNQDVATKKYVCNMVNVIRSNIGYIPSLKAAKNKIGFEVECNSVFKESNTLNGKKRRSFHPFHVFNMDNGKEWASQGASTNVWLSIKCPEPVRVWQILLCGRKNNRERISHWRFEGSYDKSIWVALLKSRTALGSDPQLFRIPIDMQPFRYFKIYVINAEASNPGLSYMQLYIYDEVVSFAREEKDDLRYTLTG